jgi:cytochrome c oxidase cbb3-type subunit I
MTQTTSSTASPGVSEIDTSSRCALSFLIVASLLWLVTGGVLALLNLLQTHTPGFLADCFLFTHGRLDAMQETALVYGWAGNAGIAVALWLLSRLAGSALRGTNYLVAGALFWNIGVKLGVYGIAFGDMTSFSLMQMPDYVQPLMLVAYALMAAPGVLAWTGRRNDSTFATQWYAIAALFLFPWFFSAAQVMLLFAPVRGTLQSVVSTWYAQNLFSLWMAPLAIAALYYLVPKIRGKVMPNYDFAIYGFWSGRVVVT